MKSRIFNIMQYEVHPETGEPLLNENQIKSALQHKTIKQYAYIMHDKDTYSKKDEEQNQLHKYGEKKPRHWHIVLKCDNAVEVQTIARWFFISDNFVDVPKGYGAFWDCLKYLTHEDAKQQAELKHLYTDDLVFSNFPFRDLLNDKASKMKSSLSEKDKMRLSVLQDGKTLLQCYEEAPLLYAQDYEKLSKLRMLYINRMQPPILRINYYISGGGGVGKSLASRALARSLCPELKNDDEIFFQVGAENATFEGYDGQPVIIWDDMRAGDFITKCGGRGNVFTILDTHPSKKRQNVKYSSVNLCNTFNIINSVQSYKKFISTLAGEEDTKQALRRVPLIFNLRCDDFDLLVNRGFLEDSDNFAEYEEYKNMVGNFGRVRAALKNEDKCKEIEGKMLSIAVDISNKKIEEAQEIKEIDDTILDEFKYYGMSKEDAEAEEKRKTETIEKYLKLYE